MFQFQYRVTVLLINKLLEEKRYNDVVRVYDHFNRNLKKQPPEKSNYFELYGLITEALYEKVEINPIYLHSLIIFIDKRCNI